VDWVGLAQDRVKSRALVKVVMNLEVIKCRKVLEWLQVGHSFIELAVSSHSSEVFIRLII
jgi:hypothetical protein